MRKPCKHDEPNWCGEVELTNELILGVLKSCVISLKVSVCSLLLFAIYKYQNDGACYEVENASLNLSGAVI